MGLCPIILKEESEMDTVIETKLSREEINKVLMVAIEFMNNREDDLKTVAKTFPMEPAALFMMMLETGLASMLTGCEMLEFYEETVGCAEKGKKC